MREELIVLLHLSAAKLGLELSECQVEKFALFAEELIKWNKKVNLTSITDTRGIVLKHFVDSLILLRVLDGCGSLMDMGSGGGFPAIPLKIMLPDLSIVSVDAVRKKILFQRHAARVLTLEGFAAIHGRCEKLPAEYSAGFDCIVSRAFSDIALFAGYAVPCLAHDGLIVAMKGKRGGVEATEATNRLAEMGLKIHKVIECSLPVTGDHRSLVVIKKRS